MDRVDSKVSARIYEHFRKYYKIDMRDYSYEDLKMRIRQRLITARELGWKGEYEEEKTFNKRFSRKLYEAVISHLPRKKKKEEESKAEGYTLHYKSKKKETYEEKFDRLMKEYLSETKRKRKLKK